ncbi:MAG: sigma-70 family RNA polymerase sigma factor, partial [Fimbriimonadaceae bacterium]|nr:sigma-70 family RNA polymerase sigma factor [Fimbriimonadaceae bacterium]
QMTLVKAYQAWERFDGRHLRSWLIRILRNERLMAIRSEKPSVSLEEEDVAEPVQEPFWNEVAWRAHAHRVLEELERLPDSFRLAIQLCDVEDMSYEEAAEALEIPIGTVRSRLFRGRQMLRNRLAPLSGQFEEAFS